MPLHLGPDENGTRTVVPAGDTVVVRLPERRTAGFRWQPDVDPSELVLVGDDYEQSTAAPGAPGTRVFTFEIRSGQPARLRLVTRRAWAPDSPGEEYVVDLDSAPDCPSG